MSKNPNLRNAAKDDILNYLKSLHSRKMQQLPISYEDQVAISQKQNLVQSVYDRNPKKIVETESTKDISNNKKIKTSVPPNAIAMSRQTINNAIDELRDVDKKIEVRDGEYHYKPTNDDLHECFPILNTARSIEIKQLSINSLAFYQTGRQYAGLVTDYINSQTINNNIYAVNCSDIILCMDLNTPEKASSTENPVSLTDRINDVLMPFALHTPESSDKPKMRKKDCQEIKTTTTECTGEPPRSNEQGIS